MERVSIIRLFSHQPAPRGRRTASALVIVLVFVALLVSLAVMFLGIVSDEVTISTAYGQAASQQKLNESAVNLAIAQINYATRSKDNASPPNDMSWASQPGAIRTYNADGSDGPVYKLYSSADMVPTNGTVFWNEVTSSPGENAFPKTGSPALYTDINAPLLTPDDTAGIIIPGRSTKYRAVYPIFNPAIISPDRGISAYDSSNGAVSAPAASYNPLTAPTGNTAAMMVQWLYVLQNGQLIAPDNGSSGTQPTFNNATPTPTTANPITGRLAFWTDDETCKVNLNTASEPAFWDTPRFEGTADRNFAKFQPATDEYQRFPGHPSTVALSAVFPSLALTSSNGYTTDAFKITPRVGEKGATNGGGSQGGKVTTNTATVVSLNRDRLYSTVDELMFKPDRTTNGAGLPRDDIRNAAFALTAHSKSPETTLFDTPRIAMWPIHSDLTLNAASQYLNPAMAPYASPYTTAYDQTIAFCSTLNAKIPTGAATYYPFFFQRADSTSAKELDPLPTGTISRNNLLYTYLQNLTSRKIPGFGGKTFLDKYGTDRDQILTEMFDYVRATNLYDDNLSQNNYATTPQYAFTPGRATAAPFFQPGHGQVTPTVYNQNPATPATATQGFGRIQTISQVALHVICTADGSNINSQNEPFPPAAPITVRNPLMTTYLSSLQRRLKSTEKVFQIAFYMQPFCPSLNWDGLDPKISYEVSGLPGLEVTGATPATPFPPTADAPFLNGTNATFTPFQPNQTFSSRAIGGTASFRTLLYGASIPAWAGAADADPSSGLSSGGSNIYPFVSQPFLFDTVNGSSLALQAFTVTVKVRLGTAASPGPVVQTLTFKFPAMNVPQPILESNEIPSRTFPSSTGQSQTYPGIGKRNWWGFRYRLAYASYDAGIGTDPDSGNIPVANKGQGIGCVIRRDADVVRSLVPTVSDNRLLAAKASSDEYALISGGSSGARIVDSLSDGSSSASIAQADPGSNYNSVTNIRGLETGATTYQPDKLPDVPPDAASTARSTLYHDWDNGLAGFADGAYINKPDEGNVYSVSINGTQSVPYFEQTQNSRATGATFFSPNRIIPSPGMFGSLPTQVKAGVPWRTLLFRPQKSHPGAYEGTTAITPDHLIMDLFWMPTVQPYALSEPFATAGKVNMNYQIVPFTKVRRDTALRAAMKGEQLSAVPTGNAGSYKSANTTTSVRFNLNLNAPSSATDNTMGTFRQFEEKFKAGTIFKSATQICEVYLVPDGQSFASDGAADDFWKISNRLTGDNSRERPYTNLYGKLTTRSNTFTVHTRVQTLKKVPNTPATTWVEGRDAVLSEYRGSTLLERYIDPTTPAARDPAKYPTDKLSDYCRVRVVNSQRFDP